MINEKLLDIHMSSNEKNKGRDEPKDDRLVPSGCRNKIKLTQYNILSKISKHESAKEKLSHKTTIIGHSQTPVNMKVHSSNRKRNYLR